jgi:hypothetical protein
VKWGLSSDATSYHYLQQTRAAAPVRVGPHGTQEEPGTVESQGLGAYFSNPTSTRDPDALLDADEEEGEEVVAEDSPVVLPAPVSGASSHREDRGASPSSHASPASAHTPLMDWLSSPSALVRGTTATCGAELPGRCCLCSSCTHVDATLCTVADAAPVVV